MKNIMLACLFFMLLGAVSAFPQQTVSVPAERAEYTQANAVRKAMASYYAGTPGVAGGVFDNVVLRLEGTEVTVSGQVWKPWEVKDIGRTLGQAKGVTKVTNGLEALPTSAFDDQLRVRLLNRIYGNPALMPYRDIPLWEKPIHIIVKDLHVTLEGVVDSQGDKNMAGILANGTISLGMVTNNLKVGK